MAMTLGGAVVAELLADTPLTDIFSTRIWTDQAPESQDVIPKITVIASNTGTSPTFSGGPKLERFDVNIEILAQTAEDAGDWGRMVSAIIDPMALEYAPGERLMSMIETTGQTVGLARDMRGPNGEPVYRATVRFEALVEKS